MFWSHDDIKHNEVRDTVNNLREEFWISNSRNFVKGIINKCSICREFEGPCYDYPKLGPLPDSRVDFDFLYLSIGIDYAGPVYVRNIYNTKDMIYLKRGLFWSHVVVADIHIQI